METTITLLHRWTPSRARKLWLVIDSIVVIWSILLLLELLTTTPLPTSYYFRLEGERAYLVYNFGTTLIWVVSCYLHLLDHYVSYYGAKLRRQPQQQQQQDDQEDPEADDLSNNEYQGPSEKEQEDIRFLIFEGIMALYFLYDSLDVYRQSSNPEVPDAKLQALDTVTNAVSYAYQVIRVLSLPKEGYMELPSVHSKNK